MPGRIGCLLNGCCYGQVVCPECPACAVHYPLSATPRYTLTEAGLQTAAGFIPAPEDKQPPADSGVLVGQVEPTSDAYAKGLRAGDIIVQANGQAIHSTIDLSILLGNGWPRGQRELTLTVEDANSGSSEPRTISFVPRTLGLHPTQFYESISMFLLFLLLTAYFPYHTRDGQVMGLLMLFYAVHRYFNEQLRNDVRPVGFEQYSSFLLFGAGVLFLLWIWWRRAPLHQVQVATPTKEVS